MMFKLLPILFASAFAGLSDKDPRCRFRLHYPGASWHTAYDVCAKENKTLARVSSEKLNIMKWVLEEVDKLTAQILNVLGETDEMWIRGFFRPSYNESMDENCRRIDPQIGINVRNTEEPGISCLYYNKTDKQLHTGNCSSPKPFLCERKTQDKEDCYLTSVLSTLKNENPIIIYTDDPPKTEDSEKECKDNCDDNCYGYIYKSLEKNCSTYLYQQRNLTVSIPSTELKHKAFFIYNSGSYPESNPKPLNEWCPEMTEEVVKQKIEKIKETLLVKKKETNRYNRTLISAPDPRQSAKNMGLVGVTVICVVVAIIILPDYINLYRECQSKTKRHRD